MVEITMFVDTNEKMKQRVKDLCNAFADYLDIFDNLGIFSGPSLYFHFRTLTRLREVGSLSQLFEDVRYFEYLYATLTAWGLHRMGQTSTKLVDFETFYGSLVEQRENILRLQHLKLTHMSQDDLSTVNDVVCEIISNINISQSGTQLVAGTKTLHHLLPDLIPPFDREHTLRFFYNKTNFTSDTKVFREIYPLFVELGERNKEVIRQYLGKGFHSSAPKVIDNAIVGFVKKNLK